MNTAEIKEEVRRRYGAFAASKSSEKACCAAMAKPVSGFATELGLYSPEELKRVPEAAVSLSRGCGNPTGFARLGPGEKVVDFGCGGGIDVILAAQQVGPAGKVCGVDMTAEMIERAKQNAAAGGIADRVDFRVADLTDTKLPDASADVVISNCVINLCPEKGGVYREALRILRPGGRLAISDVVYTEEPPRELRASFQASWAGCLGGAVARKDYFEMVTQAGFEDIAVVSEHAFGAEELAEMSGCPGPQFATRPPEAELAAVQGMVATIKFTARKPA